jgi:glucose-1-phosphate thymidylyltransferase
MGMLAKGVVVVPAAVSPHTNGNTPAIQRIANRPIACHAVENLAAAGIRELAVVAPLRTMGDIRGCIEDELAPGIEVTFLPQRGRADLLGALRAAARFVGDGPAIVHLADGLLGQPLEQIPDFDGGATADLVLLLHRGDAAREGLEPATQRLLGVTELTGSPTRLALSGVSVFGPGILRHAAAAAEDLGPEVQLLEIAEHLAAEGHTVEAAVVRGWRRYSGDPLDLLELNRLVLDQQAPQGDTVDRGDNRIEGRVIIDPTAEIVSSVLLGPCIIGPHARVTNSYIGPYTSIGAGAEIEGAEIVRSIVSEGVRIKHISGRIEASTIGRRASIFRDFGLPRAMRLHVGEDVELALD